VCQVVFAVSPQLPELGGEGAIAAVKCYRSIKEGAIVAVKCDRAIIDLASVCMSNYRSYELSEDRAIAAQERECDRAIVRGALRLRKLYSRERSPNEFNLRLRREN